MAALKPEKAAAADRRLFDALGLRGAERRDTDAVMKAITRAAGRRTRAFEQGRQRP